MYKNAEGEENSYTTAQCHNYDNNRSYVKLIDVNNGSRVLMENPYIYIGMACIRLLLFEKMHAHTRTAHRLGSRASMCAVCCTCM